MTSKVKFCDVTLTFTLYSFYVSTVMKSKHTNGRRKSEVKKQGLPWVGKVSTKIYMQKTKNKLCAASEGREFRNESPTFSLPHVGYLLNNQVFEEKLKAGKKI